MPSKTALQILLSGSHGLIGQRVKLFFEQKGHLVKRLERAPSFKDGVATWDLERGSYNREAFEGSDVIIHLAGENVGKGIWTQEKKRRIVESRLHSAKLLSQIVSELSRAPKLLLVASAVGYYGDRGALLLDEAASSSKGVFISKVCAECEEVYAGIDRKGVRVAWARLGLVLTPEGGVLNSFLTLSKWGLLGRMGSGEQYMSWIGMKDLLLILDHILNHKELSGPINVVTPSPLTQKDLVKIIARHLRRPMGAPLPKWALKLILGQKGLELLLSSQRVDPVKLKQSGYQYQNGSLESLLAELI